MGYFIYLSIFSRFNSTRAITWLHYCSWLSHLEGYGQNLQLPKLNKTYQIVNILHCLRVRWIMWTARLGLNVFYSRKRSITLSMQKEIWVYIYIYVYICQFYIFKNDLMCIKLKVTGPVLFVAQIQNELPHKQLARAISLVQSNMKELPSLLYRERVLIGLY